MKEVIAVLILMYASSFISILVFFLIFCILKYCFRFQKKQWDELSRKVSSSKLLSILLLVELFPLVLTLPLCYLVLASIQARYINILLFIIAFSSLLSVALKFNQMKAYTCNISNNKTPKDCAIYK